MLALVFSPSDQEPRLATEYPIPTPAPGEALVRVLTAGVCNTDLEILKGYMEFSGVPGHEFVGQVVELGSGDEGLVGRRVVGEINCSCGTCQMCKSGRSKHCPSRTVLGIAGRDGAFAEFLTLPVPNLHPLPDQVSNTEGVFVEPLAAAFRVLEQVSVERSDKVCVLGDGKLGLLVAQVLALTECSLMVRGERRVNLEILDSLGIATGLIGEGQGEVEDFDLVVECTGSPSGLSDAIRLVRPEGTVVVKTTAVGGCQIDETRVVVDEIRLLGSRCGPFPPAIEALAEGRIKVSPLIASTYPLSKGLEALRAAAQPGTLKVLITMGGDG